MTDGVPAPSREQFRALTGSRAVVPVTMRLLADAETPVGVYRKLAGGPGTFLLESAEHGRSWSRYSFVGARCPAMLTERDGSATWVGNPPSGLLTSALPADPLAALREIVQRLRTPRDAGLPPLTGGLVGYIAYDAVRRLERLPTNARDDLRLPDIALLLAIDLAVLDHDDGSILLVANSFPTEDTAEACYDDALHRLDVMARALDAPAPSSIAVLGSAEPSFDTQTPGGIGPAARAAKEQIRAGEAFQVVVSQRFQTRTDAPPLDIYRVLRTTNPSPYMYLLSFPDGVDVVGSSPEALVTVTGDRAMLHPIAGTRPRGATPADDAALAVQLRADPKERAEHLMLVDLGRNDLGRVCTPGSVEVVDFMGIERYSHVMHLVSTVVGEVAPGCSAFDVLAACFPAGTLSGAPKPRAMELIDELEPLRRGLYGGTVGYFDVAGDLDMAIAIRTALLRDGIAYVQAGGGIVADSDPVAEEAESRHKAHAVLAAIATAATLRSPGSPSS
ncbi:MAG: anthranilate synthase component I [Pseudonocardiales bacterium]|nr:MAG: anthranilate synthase component I [Pseudonocardiales bacterium]